MISKERFIERVKREVFPQLLGTEKERIKVLCRGIFWIILGFAVLSLFLPLENYEDKDKVDIYKKIIIIVYLFLLYRAARIWDPFIREQKRKFSPTFLNFLEHLRYGQDDIDKDLLHHSCLFSSFQYPRYDDCISGFLGNTKFALAETELSFDSSDYTPKMYEKNLAFRGICIYVPMKKSVSGYTLLFNTFIPQHIPVLKKITLDYLSFRKNYQVYSNDQIEARVLLTPVFMEKLNNLKKRFKNKRIDISFWGNHALFAIHTSEDLFESYSLFRSAKNIGIYKKFYDEIKAINDMIEILSINNESLPEKNKFNEELYEKISSAKQCQDPFINILLKIFGIELLFKKGKK